VTVQVANQGSAAYRDGDEVIIGWQPGDGILLLPATPVRRDGH
jgi:hypothetical protein